MNKPRNICDVLIVGAGPAGMAAACRAAESGRRVAVVDDNQSTGGQIWRGLQQQPPATEAAAWFERIHRANVEFLSGARVFHQPLEKLLLAETANGVVELAYQVLILATGARERFLPFPGWTLPNVMGAGGLQALVKSGLSIAGKRIVIAGSGPLLLAVAGYLRERSAEVLLIAEQAPAGRVARFGASLIKERGKVSQALALRRQLRGVPYHTGCWPIAADGKGQLEAVTLSRGRKRWRIECDYLGCGFHLVPNLELPELLGCYIVDGVVAVDDFQETSVSGIFSAGESTGIGGLELSLVEGEIAGLAAAGRRDDACSLFGSRDKQRGFARMLNNTFVLRDELRRLVEADTIVCRCEDVKFVRLQSHDSWRSAKLQTRCGMGPCQGRICGSAVEFLFGWQAQSVRPPVFPVSVESLRG
jgi:NADPH-dependent 2,4-dienoyl-CoA reductase/sulfur reductase-like enzyme